MKRTPNRKEIEEIISNSTIELILCPKEYDIDANGDKIGKPSEVFLFWNRWEVFKTFPPSMTLSDLLSYMNTQDKDYWIYEGERNIKRKLLAIEKAKKDLFN